MPLIKNPSFQPPKPVTLNANYAKALAALPGSVLPPKVNVTEEDMKKWTAELEVLREKYFGKEATEREIAVYENWLTQLQRKIAPGFNFEVMTPSKQN